MVIRPAQPALIPAEPLTRWMLVLPWLAVLGLCVAQVLFPAQVEAYGLYSFVIGILLLGLPHGALDPFIPSKLGFAWAKKPLGVGLFILAYAAIAGLYFVLWLISPLLAFVGFLVATILHWGQGDVRFLEIFLGRTRVNRWGTLVAVLLRGSLPIVLPVLAFPQTAESLYQNAVKGLGLSLTPLDLSAPAVVGGLVAYMLVLLAAYLVNAVQTAASREALGVDLLELALLAVLFLTVPAYMSVGIYFIAWHSLRHLARLIILHPDHASLLKRGQWKAPVARMTLELIPITVCAIAMLLGLYFWKAQYTTSLETFVALYLVMISALTKPHLVLVALMDYAPRKERY
jgi:beta-carotene 15,15'-dioxygenase